MSQLHMLSIQGLIPASHRIVGTGAAVLQPMGDKDMEWLAESSLITLLVSWIDTDVDFKLGLGYTARNVVLP